MSFDKSNLPDPLSYYEGQGVQFRERRGKWRTTSCNWCGGSDPMRINTETGGFVCMSCNARGGDVLAYHRALHGVDFVTACKELGCWQDDGKPAPTRPAPFTAREALSVLKHEALLIFMLGCALKSGPLSEEDRARLVQAVGRVRHVAEVAA